MLTFVFIPLEAGTAQSFHRFPAQPSRSGAVFLDGLGARGYLHFWNRPPLSRRTVIRFIFTHAFQRHGVEQNLCFFLHGVKIVPQGHFRGIHTGLESAMQPL
jgi:hypothetical protein